MNDMNNVNQPRILIVDDEELIRQSLQLAVHRSGYDCSIARDGQEALAVLAGNDIEVIVTDIRMDGMDGIQLLKAAKKKHDVDVIVMTGFSGDYTYEKIVEAGASDFILKPLGAGELTVRLKRVLRERSLKSDMINTHKELVRTLVSLIEEKDMIMKGHADRVASQGVLFARQVGLTRSAIEKVYFAGLLHDLGKVYLPLELVRKNPKQWDKQDIEQMRRHPVLAEKILSKVSMLKKILPIIRHHHEANDGNGYPDGLKGDQIPVEAKILGLVDSFDNMTNSDSNGSGISEQKALAVLAQNATGQFDADIVGAFVSFKGDGTVDKKESAHVDNSRESIETEKTEGGIREAVIEIVQKYKNGEIVLPVLPKIVEDIQRVTKDPASTVDHLVNVIEKDAVVSIRLVAIANSPIYRGADKYTTVKEAIPRLGVKEIQNIVSAIATKSLFETKNKHYIELMQDIWSHSLACAYCARSLAVSLQLGDPDKLFFMGLLHDVGKLPLIKSLAESLPGNGSSDLQEVISNIQAIHTSFGGIMLERWGFGKDYIEIVKQHEKEDFPESVEKEILMVGLANMLTRKLGYSHMENGIDPLQTESAKRLELTPAQLDKVLKESETAMQDSGNAI